ncbi:MAG: glycosyltransferase family 1 protein [Alphaproteobacteria bacterium]|nr:glycosyltransferase family 1 protein [Alphaproteobacteria bacterium]
MRIAFVTDAWFPQENGVVRVLSTLIECLKRLGHEILLIEPGQFTTLPCPTYPEIRLALGAGGAIGKQLDDFAPEALHLLTEGPLGWAARAFALKRGWPFTTAYHSKFPEYIQARTGLPLSWLYAPVRKFHQPSSGVLCPSPSVYRELAQRGFVHLREWTHGVDTQVFHPQPKDFLDLPRPIHMYVGRVTVEKNLPAFLELDLPGSKLVVGSGPARKGLMRIYPQAHFRIAHGDAELSMYFASADVFVFPSLTDTFGLVMLEALASGVPVAAFPVTGPVDVLGDSGVGILDWDLALAAKQALSIDPQRCRAHALTFSWDRVAEQFLDFLAPIQQVPARRCA